MKIMIRLLILVPLLAANAARANAGPAPGPGEVNCAAEEMQLFYYYLNPAMDDAIKEFKPQCVGSPATIKMPDWLQKAKPAMLERKVWKDPEEGELSEAALWQAPVSILYELASTTRKTLPAAEGKPGPSPLDLEGDFSDIRLRFVLSVDRLTRAKLEDSFEGRGKGMLSTMNMVMERLDKIKDALAESDNDAFNKNTGEALKLGRGLFAQLFEAPRGGDGYKFTPQYTPKAFIVPGYRGVSLPVSGQQTLFLESGDRIDVLVTFEALLSGGVKETVTATMLQNVVVLRVSRPDTPGGGGVVQLLCNPNEAQYAALSLAQGKTINLIRRAPGDFEMRPMEIASLRKLIK
jgi:hypothetical protein